MDPSCLVSTVQAGGGGVMVWGGDIFLAHFGPLSTNWASFKRHSLPEYCCWPCPSLYNYSYPSSDGYFQQDNAPCHKAQIISDRFLEHDNEFTLLKWPPQSSDLNPTEHLWDVVHHGCAADKAAATAWCYHVVTDGLTDTKGDVKWWRFNISSQMNSRKQVSNRYDDTLEGEEQIRQMVSF